MNIEIKIDKANQIRISTITGKFTLKELLEKLKEIYSDQKLFNLPNSIWDISKADLSSFTAEQIQKLTEFVAGSWGKDSSKKTAIVAGQDFIYGMSRMYAQTLEFKTSNTTVVFHEYDEALTWLTKGTLPTPMPDETIVG